MFAVMTTGGKQYRVEAGSELVIERVPGDAGSSITFDRVLLIGDGDSVTVGTPTVTGATVTGTVLGEELGPKLVVFKFKQKVKYRRHTGHRQHLLRVRIDDITGAPKAKASAKAEAEADAPAADATEATLAEAKPKRTRKPAAAKPKAESEE
ncbi:MAG TPA: 50S ribosomal protein L21 [Candidatus Limnocylindria bacterium]